DRPGRPTRPGRRRACSVGGPGGGHPHPGGARGCRRCAARHARAGAAAEGVRTAPPARAGPRAAAAPGVCRSPGGGRQRTVVVRDGAATHRAHPVARPHLRRRRRRLLHPTVTGCGTTTRHCLPERARTNTWGGHGMDITERLTVVPAVEQVL